MKKLLFIFFALLTCSSVIYASFPVTEQSEVVVNNQPIEVPAPDVDWGLFVICWLVGSLGVHRFMIGDTTNGILMLLTLGGCGIWTIIDLISIATGKMSR